MREATEMSATEIREAFDELGRQDFTGVTLDRKQRAHVTIHEAARAYVDLLEKREIRESGGIPDPSDRDDYRGAV